MPTTPPSTPMPVAFTEGNRLNSTLTAEEIEAALLAAMDGGGSFNENWTPLTDVKFRTNLTPQGQYHSAIIAEDLPYNVDGGQLLIVNIVFTLYKEGMPNNYFHYSKSSSYAVILRAGETNTGYTVASIAGAGEAFSTVIVRLTSATTCEVELNVQADGSAGGFSVGSWTLETSDITSLEVFTENHTVV